MLQNLHETGKNPNTLILKYLKIVCISQLVCINPKHLAYLRLVNLSKCADNITNATALYHYTQVLPFPTELHHRTLTRHFTTALYHGTYHRTLPLHFTTALFHCTLHHTLPRHFRCHALYSFTPSCKTLRTA